MNKRQRKKHLFKGNCPVCRNDNKVTSLRTRSKDLKYPVKNQWVVSSCDCGYKEN